jgi:glutamate racemase/XTP/dITP diphosphohydrolase
MTRLIIASNNPKKKVELQAIIEQLHLTWEVVDLSVLPVIPPMIEDGTTFVENARIKAQAIREVAPNDYVLADDSGLLIAVLDGEPGVYSARYAGDHDDAANNQKVLAKLTNVPAEQRQASFKSVVLLKAPNGDELQATGEVTGHIATELIGEGGFGYDPLFIVEETGLTFAQMSAEQKNLISHRGRALAQLAEQLPSWLAQQEGK